MSSSAPVQAPVSGVVKQFSPPGPAGIVQAVVIENDGEERLDPAFSLIRTWTSWMPRL